MVNIRDYNFKRCDRGNCSGGVGIFVKSKFKADIINHEVLENVLVKVTIGRQEFIVCVVYRPPSQCIMVLNEAITTSLSKISHFIMIGDINFNLLSHPNSLLACLEAHGLSQLVKTPTRITDNCANLFGSKYMQCTRIM